MGGVGVLVEDGRLAADLSASLEPRLQDPLNHPTRREILRVLNAGRKAQTITAIVAKLPPLTRGEISYHVQVLQDSECVAVDGTRPALRGRERLLRSAVGDCEQALLVLGATQRSDRVHRARKGGGSSSLLTMFRIPRPGRTIRLGRSRRAEPKQ
jgi:hypothetical protein